MKPQVGMPSARNYHLPAFKFQKIWSWMLSWCVCVCLFICVFARLWLACCLLAQADSWQGQKKPETSGPPLPTSTFTVAILAQGTHWADAVTQAFLGRWGCSILVTATSYSSSPHPREDLALCFWVSCRAPCWPPAAGGPGLWRNPRWGCPAPETTICRLLNFRKYGRGCCHGVCVCACVCSSVYLPVCG